MTSKKRLPVRLSPRPVSAMLYRFGRACEAFIFYSTCIAKGTVAGTFLLVLCITPPA